MSANPKLTNGIIVGFGLVSSLAAMLIIMQFVGFELSYQKVLDISSQAYASVAGSLADMAKGIVEKTASLSI